MSRLVDTSGRVGLPEDSEKTRPAGTNICLKIPETAMSCFGCFVQATSPDKDSGQLGRAPRDHLPIAESDVDFERFIETGKCDVPSFKTSLGNRYADQQVSPFSHVNIC